MTRTRLLELAAWLTVAFQLPAFPAGSLERPASAREVMSLDGQWDILFDPTNQGRDAGWNRDDIFEAQPTRRTITVPSCWELVEKDYEGVAFYRRKFRVPASWAGRVVRLHFDAVNFRAEVWLNGTAVGCHDGGFTPFEFRVDDLLRPGQQNTLIVRVVGPILLQNKRVDGLGPMETPQWRGAITGGIWQSVRLIATGDVYVKDVFIEPRINNNTAIFHIDLDNGSEKARKAMLQIAIRPANDPAKVVSSITKQVELPPGISHFDYTLSIPNAKYWSPDHPYLYRADVRVIYNGVESDHWNTRFGMREFTIRDGRFYLNGRPIYLKAAFFEGLYPTRLAYPDSRRMVVREIALAKAAGFNMIRPWRKPPVPMWLDIADEMGVLTVGSFAIECMGYPVETAHLPKWVENEIRETILRDRNRACVVQWELFNELKRPVLKRLLRPMALLARRLDPTRLIVDESGGWARGARAYLPYQREPIRFNDIHFYPGQHINDEVYKKLVFAGRKSAKEMRQLGLRGPLPSRNVVPGRMTYFSELGYGSLPDLVDCNERFAKYGNPIAPPTIYHQRLAEQHRRVLKESGFSALYPDLRKFCLDQQRIHGRANQRMIEAVRCNPQVAGYCIHALVAGDWILGAGLLDLWRNPKSYAYEGTKAANRPRIVVVRVRPRNVYAKRGTTIEITGVNELEAIRGQLKVMVMDDTGAIVWEKKLAVQLGSGITPLLKEKLKTERLRGPYVVRAELSREDGVLVASNEFRFDVFGPEQLAVPKGCIAVLDPTHDLKPFLRRIGVPYVEYGKAIGPKLPVFVARTVAHTPAQRQLFKDLAEFIRKGGTAVYLQAGGPQVPWGRGGEASPLLPVHAWLKRARGYWTCIPHLVKEHPIFKGLPTGGMMGPIYENVCADSTLVGIQGEIIVCSIGFDWFPNYDRSKRHYYGPGDAWWGADLAIVPFGRGRCILSRLRLVENLGRDPVADKILLNLIAWTHQLTQR